MCTEAYVIYEKCKCKVLMTTICNSHIAHTREQVDNKPCPHYVRSFALEEKIVQKSCDGRKGMIMEDGRRFKHGRNTVRPAWEFERDPTQTGGWKKWERKSSEGEGEKHSSARDREREREREKENKRERDRYSKEGRRARHDRAYGHGKGSGSGVGDRSPDAASGSGSRQARIKIKKEEPAPERRGHTRNDELYQVPEPPKIKTEPLTPPRRPNSFELNPSSFYNTEPISAAFPPAYTPTSANLLSPYDAVAEGATMFGNGVFNREFKEGVVMGANGEGSGEGDGGAEGGERKRVKIKEEVSVIGEGAGEGGDDVEME